MSTGNRRIAAYLPKEIDDRLKAFIAEHNLKGDSPAIIAILSQFFGVSREVAYQSSSVSTEFQQRFEIIENQISNLRSELREELLSELREELLKQQKKVTTQLDVKVEDELLSELNSEPLNFNEALIQVEPLSELINELPKESSNSIAEEPLSNLISEPPKFDEVSEQLDEAPKQLESPSELVDEPHKESSALISEESLSEPPSKPLARKTRLANLKNVGLSMAEQFYTTTQLAKRLGASDSLVSHWKPTGNRSKTPDALLETTRKKDPDGIGWIYLPDINRFQPERTIPGELP